MRLYTQHFQHGKAVRYTRPHRKLAMMFTKAVTSRQGLSLNFAELIFSELKSYATKIRKSKNIHMNCGPMLTRIAYFAMGMIDELPEAQSIAYWIDQSQTPQANTVKEIKEAAPSTRTRSKKQLEEKKSTPLESSSEEEKDESSDNFERTESDDEEMKEIKEELKEKPTIFEQRARWEEIQEQIMARERRTKARQDPSHQPLPKQVIE